MIFTGPFQSGGRIPLPRLAASLGFFCWQNEQEIWHIQPRKREQSVTSSNVTPTSEADGTANSLSWTLQQQAEDRWLLLVKGVPQISMQPQEAIAFLNRQQKSLKTKQNKTDNN